MKFDPMGVSEKRITKGDIFFRILNGETAYFVFAGGKGKPKSDERWSNYWPDTGPNWPDGTCFFDKAELDEWIEGMVTHLKKEGNLEAISKEEGLYFQIVTLKMAVDSTIEWGVREPKFKIGQWVQNVEHIPFQISGASVVREDLQHSPRVWPCNRVNGEDAGQFNEKFLTPAQNFGEGECGGCQTVTILYTNPYGTIARCYTCLAHKR